MSAPPFVTDAMIAAALGMAPSDGRPLDAAAVKIMLVFALAARSDWGEDADVAAEQRAVREIAIEVVGDRIAGLERDLATWKEHAERRLGWYHEAIASGHPAAAGAARGPVLDELKLIRTRCVQALHAGFSRRDWHSTERAGIELRDRLDALIHQIEKAP